MNELLEGFRHITDPEGYDHMLYLAAMCAPYVLRDWKKVVLLATAFTAGHCVTLILSASGWLRFSTDLIELLIPVTIVLTCVSNLAFMNSSRMSFKYIVNLFFGLIHGMGFSSYFRMMYGGEEGWIWKLLGFNLGVELGQVLIITVYLLLSWAFISGIRLPRNSWNYGISAVAMFIAMLLIYNKL